MKQADDFASLQRTITFLETYTVDAADLKRSIFLQTLDNLRAKLPTPCADKTEVLQMWSSTLRLGAVVSHSSRH